MEMFKNLHFELLNWKNLLNCFWIQNLRKAWINWVSVVDYFKGVQTYNIKNLNPGLVEFIA